MTQPTARPAGSGRRHRYAVLVACVTFLLVIAGGLVTSTGSGLAVPDWPLSFGQVFPRMEGGVLFEHGHRMIAAAVGLLTVILAIWTARTEERRWVRALGWAMLGVVVLQGVLGGMTVLMRLPDAVSVAHAGLAQIFFALTVTMAGVTSVTFVTSRHLSSPSVVDAGFPSTRSLTLATLIAVYTQILLGAVVRHTGAGLAIPDFPLSYGKLVPVFYSSLIAWSWLHRAFAFVVLALIAWTSLSVLIRHGRTPWLVRPALALFALGCWQIFLGALTIWTRRAVTPTTAHVATGALTFVTTTLLAVRCHRALGAAAVPDELPQSAGLAAQ